jgi:hypothetical protein
MKFKFKSAVIVVAIGMLSACGGAGGDATASNSSTTNQVPTIQAPTSQVLKGTVAGGAAVVGNVIITDSKGKSISASIAVDGTYTVDVSTLTGPFLLKAAGTVGNTSVTYYSAATKADINGVVNVTPFTDLMVSNIAAQLAVNYFNSPANMANIGALITPASLAAAQSAMQAKLQPVLAAMGLGTSVDLLHTQFTANHSGLDAVLDLVKVDTTTSNATLTNALTQVVIGSNNYTSTTLDATPVSTANIAGINPGTATTLQTVTSKLGTLAALFANGLPSYTALQNSGIFDTSSNFSMSGQTFAQWATQMSTYEPAIGMTFTNVAISLDPSGITATLDGVISSKTASFGGSMTTKLVKDPVKGWLVVGDGKIANLGINARAQLDYWSTVTIPQSGSNMLNGLHVYIDAFDYNSNHSSAMITTAVVTGPGLPVSGINMIQDTKNTWFDVAAYGAFDLIPECGTLAYSNSGNIPHATGQCITIGQVVDNSDYIVLLKDANGNVLNGSGDKLRLGKKPYAMSDLTPSMFPNITSATINGNALSLSNIGPNQSVAINWSLPAGLVANNTNIWSSVSSGASYVFANQNLASTTASQTILSLGSAQASGTVNDVGVWLGTRDVFGRALATSRDIHQ